LELRRNRDRGEWLARAAVTGYFTRYDYDDHSVIHHYDVFANYDNVYDLHDVHDVHYVHDVDDVDHVHHIDYLNVDDVDDCPYNSWRLTIQSDGACERVDDLDRRSTANDVVEQTAEQAFDRRLSAPASRTQGPKATRR